MLCVPSTRTACVHTLDSYFTPNIHTYLYVLTWQHLHIIWAKAHSNKINARNEITFHFIIRFLLIPISFISLVIWTRISILFWHIKCILLRVSYSWWQLPCGFVQPLSLHGISSANKKFQKWNEKSERKTLENCVRNHFKWGAYISFIFGFYDKNKFLSGKHWNAASLEASI